MICRNHDAVRRTGQRPEPFAASLSSDLTGSPPAPDASHWRRRPELWQPWRRNDLQDFGAPRKQFLSKASQELAADVFCGRAVEDQTVKCHFGSSAHST